MMHTAKFWLSHTTRSAVVATLATVFAAPSIFAQAPAKSSSSQSPTTLTATLREGLDTTVSPCEDFDQYVNGGWRAKQGGNIIDIFRDARLRTDGQLLTVLESARRAAPTTKDPVIRLLGTFYESCLATDTISSVLPTTPGGRIAETRQEGCLIMMDQLFRPGLSYAYVQHVMPPKTAALTQQFLTTIQTSIREQVHGMTWLDDSLKQRSLRVLDTMAIRVRFKPDSVNFGDLTFHPAQYAANRAAVTKWAKEQADREKKRPWTAKTAAEEIEHAVPYHIQARAFQQLHIIEVTPIFFQPPFYDEKGEPAANYASLGMVLGHEMWHLLTPFFRWIDSDEGKKRASVLVNNYAKFGDSGWSTVNEDFGDLGGVLAAYAAWQKNARKGNKERVEGFTPEQRFFLHYGQLWRNTDRSSRDSKHSGSRARINGVVMQVPAFAKAFGCRDTDPMVLEVGKRANIF